MALHVISFGENRVQLILQLFSGDLKWMQALLHVALRLGHPFPELMDVLPDQDAVNLHLLDPGGEGGLAESDGLQHSSCVSGGLVVTCGRLCGAIFLCQVPLVMVVLS